MGSCLSRSGAGNDHRLEARSAAAPGVVPQSSRPSRRDGLGSTNPPRVGEMTNGSPFNLGVGDFVDRCQRVVQSSVEGLMRAAYQFDVLSRHRLLDADGCECVGLLLVSHHPNRFVIAKAPNMRDPVVHLRATTPPPAEYMD
jgi:hypothetical protein